MSDRRDKRIEETRAIVEAMRTDHDHHNDQTPEELRESAYRRGFEHGLQLARDVLTWAAPTSRAQADALLRALARHVNDWRYRLGKYHTKDRARLQPPPWDALSTRRPEPDGDPVNRRPGDPESQRLNGHGGMDLDAGGWVDAEHVVPAFEGRYLVYGPSADPEHPFLYTAWFAPDDGWSLLPDPIIRSITHWMEIPPPPVEEPTP